MVQEVQRAFGVFDGIFGIINLRFAQYLLGAGIDGGAQIFVFIFSVRHCHLDFPFQRANILIVVCARWCRWQRHSLPYLGT